MITYVDSFKVNRRNQEDFCCNKDVKIEILFLYHAGFIYLLTPIKYLLYCLFKIIVVSVTGGNCALSTG